MQLYKFPLTFAIHHLDIKIIACCTKTITRSFVTRFCAYNRLRYQVSVYRAIGSLACCLYMGYACLFRSQFWKNTILILNTAVLCDFVFFGGCLL